MHVVAKRTLLFLLYFLFKQGFLLLHRLLECLECLVQFLIQLVQLGVALSQFVMFLHHPVVFLLQEVDPLVEHLHRVLQLLGVGHPVLLLQLLDVLEVETGHLGRGVTGLGVLALDAVGDHVDGGVHEVLKVHALPSALSAADVKGLVGCLLFFFLL